MPFNVKKQKSTRPYTRVNLTSPGSQALTYTFAAFPPLRPHFIFVPLFPLFVSLPPLHSSEQGRPRLFEFWMPHTSFAHSISSFKFAPPPSFSLSSSSSLIQCCLPITSEVKIISWSHGQTVDRTLCGRVVALADPRVFLRQ